MDSAVCLPTFLFYILHMGEQVVLKSRKAFSHIAFQGFELADSGLWYPKKKERDDSARRAYFGSRSSKRKKGDLFISQIIDGGMKADESCRDHRLRQPGYSGIRYYPSEISSRIYLKIYEKHQIIILIFPGTFSF